MIKNNMSSFILLLYFLFRPGTFRLLTLRDAAASFVTKKINKIHNKRILRDIYGSEMFFFALKKNLVFFSFLMESTCESGNSKAKVSPTQCGTFSSASSILIKHVLV